MVEKKERKRSTVGRLSSVAIGAAFTVGDAVGAVGDTTANVTRSVVHLADRATAPIRKPLDAIGVTHAMMAPVEAVANRVEIAADSLEEKGRTELVESAWATVERVGVIVDAVIAYLSDNPQVDTLIRTQVDKLMPYLAVHPAVEALVRAQVAKALPILVQSSEIQELIRVQAAHYVVYLNDHPEVLDDLIRTQGDQYIDYLNAYPAAVQNLIQGQSLSLAGQVRDEVRQRTVTADTLVDTVVRNLLRMRPREELPPPNESVQRRAEYGRLPSDYLGERTNGGT